MVRAGSHTKFGAPSRASSGRRRSRRGSRYSRTAAQPQRRYTLRYLLSRQPKTLAKHRDYPRLEAYLEQDAALGRFRMSRRCYSLLHNARIKEHNLHHFFRTYRAPRHPFFLLFLQIKNDYAAERERVRYERYRYILERMRALPEPVVEFIRYLGHLENFYNPAGEHPLWQAHLFPSTKKRVHSLARYSDLDWIALFRAHLKRMQERYHEFRLAEQLLACYILDCVPANRPPQLPPPPRVKRAYRALSLRHHPDHGGEARIFLELKRAYELLYGRSARFAQTHRS